MAHGSDYRSRQGRGYLSDLHYETPDYGEGGDNAEDISLSSDDYNRENWWEGESLPADRVTAFTERRAHGGAPAEDPQQRYGTAAGQYAGRGTQEHRPDNRIYEDICVLMTDDPQLDASDIEVDVRDAEVTLTGTVDDRRAKRLAEHIAESVPGVFDIHNRIRIRRSANRT